MESKPCGVELSQHPPWVSAWGFHPSAPSGAPGIELIPSNFLSSHFVGASIDSHRFFSPHYIRIHWLFNHPTTQKIFPSWVCLNLVPPKNHPPSTGESWRHVVNHHHSHLEWPWGPWKRGAGVAAPRLLVAELRPPWEAASRQSTAQKTWVKLKISRNSTGQTATFQ